MANIPIGGLIDNSLSVPNDSKKYGPYAKTADKSALQVAFDQLDNDDVLCVGLTVGIINDDGSITEYWFKSACDSVDALEPKNAGGTSVSLNTSTRKLTVGDNTITIPTGGGGGLSEKEKENLAKLMAATFPLTVAYKTKNNGTVEYGTSVTPSVEWTAKREGEDVTVENAEVTTNLSGGSLSDDKKSYSASEFRITSEKKFKVTVTEGGQSVELDEIKWTPSYYRYYGALSSIPTDYAKAIESLSKAHTSKNPTKALSTTSTLGSTSLAANMYYLFAVKGEVTLVCRHASTDGVISDCITGTVNVPLENGYNSITNIYSYILVPAAQSAWNFKITNS